jgi:hypothetical protein
MVLVHYVDDRSQHFVHYYTIVVVIVFCSLVFLFSVPTLNKAFIRYSLNLT